MAEALAAAPHEATAFSTQRRDLWWVEPALIVVLFAAFVGYSMFRVFEANNPATRFFSVSDPALGYHYLSPFGTPDLTGLLPAAAASTPVLGVFLANPAFLVLPLPAGFRFTCYYYRKAYYRAFVGRPAACGVEAVKGARYRGEKRIMIFQNVHRYFLYAALIITLFLAWDALQGMWVPNSHWDITHEGLVTDPGHHWYFGAGNLLMIVNVALLAAYTFGCHSLRHLVGGRLDCFSCDALSQTRYSWWRYVSRLNQRHMLFALTSLVSVGLTDIYIRWLGVMQASGAPVIGFHPLWLPWLVPA
ncbi:MAG: succinate dehydrogenase [Thermoplasmatota archaeon]